MNVTARCPHCGATSHREFAAEARALTCPDCGTAEAIPDDALDGTRIQRCLVCPSTELYVRKDFPQQLGVGIVVVGFALSCVAYSYYYFTIAFAILFATALIDLVLYLLMGNSLICYRCQAEYRGVELTDVHGAFDLAIHERYRQQAARLAEAQAPKPL